MRSWILTMALSCACLHTAAEAAPLSRPPVRPVTVGQFAVQVSVALGAAPATQEDAARGLRALGVDLVADLADPLTEGVAARLMVDLGYSVVLPVNPSAQVSESKAGVLAGAITVAALPQDLATDRFSSVSASLPPLLQCLQSPNLGQCTQCCVAQLPSQIPTGAAQQACNRICMLNLPPVSPSSPG